MKLFADIDTNKTLALAKRKLRGYRRLLAIAGEEYTPKVTQRITDEPRGGGGQGNATENMVLRRVQALNELEEIDKGIAGLSDLELGVLLEKKYCTRRPQKDIVILTDFGWSEDYYYSNLKKALLEFAEVYRHGKLLVQEEVDENFLFNGDWQ